MINDTLFYKEFQHETRLDPQSVPFLCVMLARLKAAIAFPLFTWPSLQWLVQIVFQAIRTAPG